MPRCPFKGVVKWNPHLQRNMHVVATYQQGKYNRPVYSDLIHELAKIFRKNLREDDQVILAIAGPPGSCKSSLGMTIAWAMDPDWSLEKGYIYSYEDFLEKIEQKSTNQIFLFDEASLVVNAKDAMSKDSRNIISMLDTCRSRHNTCIFILPGFEDLTKSIRERLCQCRIHCAARTDTIVPGYGGRGFFKVYFPVRREFGESYWKLVGTGVFSKLDEEIETRYKKVKTMHQNELIDSWTKRTEEEVEE